jgi:hypothetical protein
LEGVRVRIVGGTPQRTGVGMRKRQPFERDMATGSQPVTSPVEPTAYDGRIPDDRRAIPQTVLPAPLAEGIAWDEV